MIDRFQDRELGVGRVLSVVLAHVSTLLLVAFSITAIAALRSVGQEDVYSSSVTMQVASTVQSTVASAALSDPSLASDESQARRFRSAVTELRSKDLEDAVAREAGVPVSVVDRAVVVGRSENQTVTVESRADSRAVAQRVATAFGTVLPARLKADAVAAGEATARQVELRLAAVNARIRAVAAAADAATSVAGGVPPAGSASELAQLFQQRGSLSERLDDIDIQAAALADGVSVVEPAGLPSEPVLPNIKRDVLLGLLLGLLLGVTAAFVVDALDPRVRRLHDLSPLLPEGVPAIDVSHKAGLDPMVPLLVRQGLGQDLMRIAVAGAVGDNERKRFSTQLALLLELRGASSVNLDRQPQSIAGIPRIVTIVDIASAEQDVLAVQALRGCDGLVLLVPRRTSRAVVRDTIEIYSQNRLRVVGIVRLSDRRVRLPKAQPQHVAALAGAKS